MTTITSPTSRSMPSRRARAIEMMDSIERKALAANMTYALHVWKSLRAADLHGSGKGFTGGYEPSLIAKGNDVFWTAVPGAPGMVFLKHPQAVRRALENFLNKEVQKHQEIAHV